MQLFSCHSNFIVILIFSSYKFSRHNLLTNYFDTEYDEHQVTPPLSRKNIGDGAEFGCASNGRARWFYSKKNIGVAYDEISNKYIRVSGSITKLSMESVKLNYIGFYYCYGSHTDQQVENTAFLSKVFLKVYGT